MIGQRQSMTRGWIVAAVLSVTVHAAAAGVFVFRPHLKLAAAPTPPELRVTTLSLPSDGPDAALTLTPVSAAQPQQVAMPPEQVITPEPSPQLSGETLAPLISDSAAPIAPASHAAKTNEPRTSAPQPGNDEETDPRLAEMFQRIRERLTDSCLLAIPALRQDGQIQLDVMAADDRQIPSLIRDLTQGQDPEITGNAVLLDARQCPGLAFARRDARYPILPLGIELASQNLASGSSLRGSISGGSGYYTTLVMVDDNGVAHDLRRFLINSAGRVTFDIPAARVGNARDTHQLLVAIATSQRPASVTANAGREAETFFDQLSAELRGGFLVGVTSFYVQ